MRCFGSRRKRLLLVVFAALLLALRWSVADAQSAEPARVLEWRCWLETDRQFNMYCVEVAFDDLLDADDRVAGARADTAGATAGNDVASLVRRNPAETGGRVWLIPLYNLPFDLARVRLLARSVMCGRDPRCVVYLDTATR